ncbi:MAG: hypothetical protein UT34_C0001G0144 [candidate division WS6 bacterium GW2011_GWF2_39_15]|uniref:UbiA prenyltransferase n=1 Tax=candidate division WS6 bacterium GW2011_GWF2_39_15 TaxID=1619100 RepID=A0A0G0MQ07_9BACT|nr:MAG: hypothetical protein UT34_C0001G0144 [candidate division WS6 bacterium GW2011_GWF2_39_15]
MKTKNKEYSIKDYVLEYMFITRTGRLISFSYIVIGVFLLGGYQAINYNYGKLFETFLFAGVLAYGGVYAFNKYTDYTEDQKVEYKSKKSKIFEIFSRDDTLVIAIVNMLLGSVLTHLFLPQIFVTTISLITINIIYSIYLKKFNRLLAVLLISTTGPLKLLIGMQIIGGSLEPIIPILFTHFSLSLAVHIYKQQLKGYLTDQWYNRVQVVILCLVLVFSLYIYTVLQNIVPLLFSIIGISSWTIFRYTGFKKIFLH